MTQVYKVPKGITREQVAALEGSEGSRLNPIEDAEGNLILSQQEWDAQEFQQYKTMYAELIGGFELIEYKPKRITIPLINDN